MKWFAKGKLLSGRLRRRRKREKRLPRRVPRNEVPNPADPASAPQLQREGVRAAGNSSDVSDSRNRSAVRLARFYSYLKAMTGLTCVARLAGIQQATTPIIKSKNGTTTSVRGSCADTPQSWLAISL